MLAQPYDHLLRCALSTLLLFAIGLLLLRPLWQLAKRRRDALIIVFSRAIANYFRQLTDPVFELLDMLKYPRLSSPWYMAYFLMRNGIIRSMECAMHVHNLALAVNRAHAICFPFHYNALYAKKRRIYSICLLLWLLSMCVGISDPFSRLIGFSPSDTIMKASVVTAGICYVLLCCGMIKFNNSSTERRPPSSEKDPFRILVVCMACLLMSALHDLVLSRFATPSHSWPNVLKTTLYYSFDIAYWLSLCTEEILLAMLVAEFRANVRKQFRAVFCCICGKKSQVGPQKEVKINSLIGGIK